MSTMQQQAAEEAAPSRSLQDCTPPVWGTNDFELEADICMIPLYLVCVSVQHTAVSGKIGGVLVECWFGVASCDEHTIIP